PNSALPLCPASLDRRRSSTDRSTHELPIRRGSKAGGNALLTTLQSIAMLSARKPRRPEILQTSLTLVLPCLFNMFSYMQAGRPRGVQAAAPCRWRGRHDRKYLGGEPRGDRVAPRNFCARRPRFAD